MKECYPLPGRRIDLESTSYFVHGLVHDNPLISISSEFKEIVNEELRDYTIICEDGFVNWINDSKSFNETEYFRFNRITVAQYLIYLKNYIYNKFIKKTNQTDFMKSVQKMNNLEDLEEIRKTLFRNYPSEPIGMNSLLFKLGKGTLDAPKGELPLRIRRYAYEAKESLKYAKENGLSELHIVVGCSHELPLEYLLRNQRVLSRLHV